jgi:RNA polymerase sigma-70 factor, ECF subfamily
MNVEKEGLGDRELIERFKRTGDPDWFGPLFERYKGSIYSICYAMLQNRAWAEDLVQETFVRAFRKINQFDESDHGCKFEAWLCTISRHLCISELRKTKVRPDPLPDELSHGPPDQEIMFTFSQLDAALDALPQEARRCWLLFKLDGHSYEEITGLTGYSFQQVKNYLRIARDKLEKQFQ